MKRAYIRSTLFNIAFFLMTAVCCILFLPTLLMPRTWYLKANRIWHDLIIVLERYVLNLNYEVRGAENLPRSGSYLIAAKHMSPYETFKLRVLFHDPAIVLKKELLKIPFWGWYLKKSDVIAIDRSTPESAIESIEDGGRRMKAQGRPVVIFPQGTRVWPHETPAEKPYKVGIARIQEATNLPIIPMATNSGMYWPRRGWLKSSGTVVFKFLDPIAPGLERRDVVSAVEQKLEKESSLLMEEALNAQK